VKKGFTLIELLIVLVIASLILGALVGLYIAQQRIQTPLKSTSNGEQELLAMILQEQIFAQE